MGDLERSPLSKLPQNVCSSQSTTSPNKDDPENVPLFPSPFPFTNKSDSNAFDQRSDPVPFAPVKLPSPFRNPVSVSSMPVQSTRPTVQPMAYPKESSSLVVVVDARRRSRHKIVPWSLQLNQLQLPKLARHKSERYCNDKRESPELKLLKLVEAQRVLSPRVLEPRSPSS